MFHEWEFRFCWLHTKKAVIAIFRSSNLGGHFIPAMGTYPTSSLFRGSGGLYMINLLEHLQLHHI